MNLYKINFVHYSPKDSEEGMKCLVAANNDEEVYEYLSGGEEFPNGKSIYCDWKDNEEIKYDNWYDDDNKPENFKNRMIRLKGQIYDEDYTLDDLYYGKTALGWELIKENIHLKDFEHLIDLKILKVISK